MYGFFCCCHKCRAIFVVCWFVLMWFLGRIYKPRSDTSQIMISLLHFAFLGIFFLHTCRNRHSILLRRRWTPHVPIWRGCKCFITKELSSLIWSCECRYFVYAMTLSTVTKMMKMIGEKKMCAQKISVAIFFPVKVINECKCWHHDEDTHSIKYWRFCSLVTHYKWM